MNMRTRGVYYVHIQHANGTVLSSIFVLRTCEAIHLFPGLTSKYCNYFFSTQMYIRIRSCAICRQKTSEVETYKLRLSLAIGNGLRRPMLWLGIQLVICRCSIYAPYQSTKLTNVSLLGHTKSYKYM